jgi:TorA maturation chaperone TorD
MKGSVRVRGEGFEGLARLAAARGRVYRFLATVFIRAPSGEGLLEGVGRGGLGAFLDSLKGYAPLSEKLKRGLEGLRGFLESLETLERDPTPALTVDFTHLFRGVRRQGSPPPPYESVYREGLCWGETTAEVLRLYAQQGLAQKEAWAGEPPDHISFELDFVARLCAREGEAWQRGDRDEALRLLRVEEGFLEEHLAGWITSFCENVRRHAATGFYRSWVDITEGWVLLDLELVRELQAEHRG